jgi:hypothetical protein
MHMSAMASSPPQSAHDEPVQSRAALRLSILVKALEGGLEIGIGGTWLRLFKAGDVIRTPRGYFQIEEPRLMCRVIRDTINDSVYTDSSIEAQGDLWLWLRTQANMLSDECVSKIAAACEVQKMCTQGFQFKKSQDSKTSAQPGQHSNVFTLHPGRAKN